MDFYVALLTPFDERGAVDLPRIRAHVLWLLAEGVDGFVVTATAGEFLYLTVEERLTLHRTVLDASGGHPVVPCTWDPSPEATVALTEAARAQGAAAVMLPPPLLYPMDIDGLARWYGSVAACGLPVYAYHDPHRLQAPIAPQVYRHLREEGLLTGLMDASEDPWRVRRLAKEDPGAIVACGDALLSRVGDVAGVPGFVSTLANAWPSLCLRLFREREGQLEEGMAERVNRVRDAGGIRALKAVLRMGCRAPLLPPSDDVLTTLPAAEGPS
ncbi:MAG: dihydrodipicolinate synthase family protein [Myxococcales bacterium]|nr:dihydrodipicolinate synthase family protein [Myxococcales bacterium]